MPAELDAIYEEASNFMRHEKYAEAIKVLEQSPATESRFLYVRMRCLLKLDLDDAALGCLASLERIDRHPWVAKLAQETRVMDKDSVPPPEILDELELLCAYKVAAWLFQKNRFVDALNILGEVGDCGLAEFVYARAQCLLKLGHMDETLACCSLLRDKFNDPRGAALARKITAEGLAPAKLSPLPPLSLDEPMNVDRELFPTHNEQGQSMHESLADRRHLESMTVVTNSSLAVAEEEIASLRAQNAALQQEAHGISARLEEARVNERAATEALAQAHREGTLLKERLDQPGSPVDDAGQRIAELEALKANLEAQVEHLSAECEHSATEKLSLGHGLDQIRVDRDRLKSLLEEREASLDDAAVHISDLEAAKAELEKEVVTLTAEREHAKGALQQQEKMLAETKQEVSGLEAANASLRQEIESLTSQLERSRNAENIPDEQRYLLASVELLKGENFTLSKRLADHETLVATLQQLNDVLARDLEHFRDRERTATDTLESVRTERDHLKRVLEQRELVLSGTPREGGNDTVAVALQHQIVALAKDVAPLFAAVRSSLGFLAQEVAKLERGRPKPAIENKAPNLSEGAKRRRSLLARPSAHQFSDDVIDSVIKTIRIDDDPGNPTSSRDIFD